MFAGAGALALQLSPQVNRPRAAPEESGGRPEQLADADY